MIEFIFRDGIAMRALGSSTLGKGSLHESCLFSSYCGIILFVLLRSSENPPIFGISNFAGGISYFISSSASLFTYEIAPKFNFPICIGFLSPPPDEGFTDSATLGINNCYFSNSFF